jgi:hypothetical protein
LGHAQDSLSFLGIDQADREARPPRILSFQSLGFGQVFSIPSRSPPTQTAGEGQRQELVDQGRQAVALLAQRAQDVAVFGGRPGLLYYPGK